MTNKYFLILRKGKKLICCLYLKGNVPNFPLQRLYSYYLREKHHFNLLHEEIIIKMHSNLIFITTSSHTKFLLGSHDILFLPSILSHNKTISFRMIRAQICKT